MGDDDDREWAKSLLAMFNEFNGTATIRIGELEEWIASPEGRAVIAYDPGEEIEIN